MTEDQAKTKWCPYVRQIATIKHADGSHIAISSANRCDDGAIGHCIASSCMAWRWLRPTMTTGYCGLAGRPE